MGVGANVGTGMELGADGIVVDGITGYVDVSIKGAAVDAGAEEHAVRNTNKIRAEIFFIPCILMFN